MVDKDSNYCKPPTSFRAATISSILDSRGKPSNVIVTLLPIRLTLSFDPFSMVVCLQASLPLQ